MSKHASLSHFSPYFLLFGRHPTPPSSIATQMDHVVDLDSPTTWVKVIAKRAALPRRVMPIAMENLSIAQHQNTLRYAHTWGGNYKSKVKQFDVGDFVYLWQQPNDTLDISFGRTILKIKAIRPSRVLELQGANGCTICTTTYCAFLRRAKQKIWRFCERKIKNLKDLQRKKNLPNLRCLPHRNLWRTSHRKFRMNL